MIRVTVELVPFGDEEFAKPIATMLIANVGGPENGLATYVGAYTVGTEIPAVKTATHYRNENVWSLIRNVLTSRKYGIPEDDTYCEAIGAVLVSNLPNYNKEQV